MVWFRPGLLGGLMLLALASPRADTRGMRGDGGTVLFWGAVILGIVWLIRRATRGDSPRGPIVASTESPPDILDRRFAEGARTPRRDFSSTAPEQSNGSRKDSVQEPS